ncbi:MAG: bis(5'-nucleosyl)-tetraphosphatase (symmetrical) YqeK [Anaerolineae bacterium]|nr:bis(5'-nucleosyl)-tetraphosphatase (symmetrical) YqeK [Anaerolineae bacterium]
MEYTPELEAHIGQWAEGQVPPERVEHVRGVVITASRLADRYAPGEARRVRLGGWIHDVAKAWDDARLLAYAEAHNLPISDIERVVPMLLHGAVSYALAATHFGLNDDALREACALHTTGAPGMCMAAKIVFLADLCEPTRNFKRVKRLRATLDHNLNSALLLAADITLRHLIKRGRIIDPRGVALRNALLLAGATYT